MPVSRDAVPAAAGVRAGPGVGEDVSWRWQNRVVADIHEYGADLVVQAIVDTHGYVAERGYTAQQSAQLKWAGYAWWALPDVLMVDPKMLRLRDGAYHRSWVCVVNGVEIDKHVYVDAAGSCQVCGY